MIVTLSRDELSWTKNIVYKYDQKEYHYLGIPKPELEISSYTFELAPNTWRVMVNALTKEATDETSRNHCNYSLVISALNKLNDYILAVAVEEALSTQV